MGTTTYHTKEKIEINETLVSYMDVSCENMVKFFLDSPELNTLKTLRKYGLDNNCIIPNHEEKLRVPSHVTWLNMPAIGGLRKLEPFSVGWMWLDYCGHIDGNKSKLQFPKKDIEYAFKNQVFADQSVFAVTLCRRSINSRKNKKEYTETCNFIFKTAQKYGYDLEFLTGAFYKKQKNMYYIAYRILR